ncbi:MAG: VacB/RNase II family 3'-5' exoribonuclease [Armatimonadetes bacterium]|nr:VacB/RNase II family 3'-5' exoribonuclease [Armatimonadota bacterium]
MPASRPELVTGHVSVHPRGFGFLNFLVEGESYSAFIAPPELNPFLGDDVVQARLVAGSEGRLSVTDLRLVQRVRRVLFGEVVRRRGRAWLHPDPEVANTDWPLEGAGTPGQFLLGRPQDDRVLPLRVLEEDADLPLERLIARYDLLEEFRPEALALAREILQRPHSLGHRRDLRELPTVTIDSASTRDLDDAISALPAGADGALRLLISIADPCAFIEEGSPLDLDARARGTSAYLAGRTLPMLPHELSSDWLSLHPGQDRVCLTAELRIDPDGEVLAVDLYESLIRSRGRLTYDEVAAWLDRDRLSPALEPVKGMLPWLRTAAARLSVARQRRGGVRITGEQAEIRLDAGGAVTDTNPSRTTSAHLLIERFMVAANEAVARWLVDRGAPGIFRVHPEPSPQRVRELADCARHFGYEAGFGPRLTPGGLAALDAQISGSPVELAIRSVMRGMLGTAHYSVQPGLHLGLAAPLYLHFTSPLRRYADLSVHRILKSYLHGHRDWDPALPELERLARHIDERARAASRAEAARRRVLLAGYMAGHLGEEFEAHITRLLPVGLLAQLDASLVEGLIPLEALPSGPWRLDPRQVSLEGPEGRFTPGIPVRVRLERTDSERGRIELALVELPDFG